MKHKATRIEGGYCYRGVDILRCDKVMPNHYGRFSYFAGGTTNRYRSFSTLKEAKENVDNLYKIKQIYEEAQQES